MQVKIFYIPDSFGPNKLVQPSVDAYILCAHLLGGKLADFFDCTRSSLFETDVQEPLVHVYGVHTGNHLIDRRFTFAFPS